MAAAAAPSTEASPGDVLADGRLDGAPELVLGGLPKIGAQTSREVHDVTRGRPRVDRVHRAKEGRLLRRAGELHPLRRRAYAVIVEEVAPSVSPAIPGRGLQAVKICEDPGADCVTSRLCRVVVEEPQERLDGYAEHAWRRRPRKASAVRDRLQHAASAWRIVRVARSLVTTRRQADLADPTEPFRDQREGHAVLPKDASGGDITGRTGVTVT